MATNFVKNGKLPLFVTFEIQYDCKNTISGVRLSPGSAETLVRRDGIINHHSTAYSLSNISAKITKIG